MSTSSSLGRRVLVGTAATAALAIGASPAMAHHCFIPMYSLSAPTSSNWLVFSAQDGAGLGGYEAQCEGAAAAGYEALEDAGLPVGIKIFEKLTIGDPKETGRMNPNGANGIGLEYFGAGSTLPDDMVETWIEGAEGYSC